MTITKNKNLKVLLLAFISFLILNPVSAEVLTINGAGATFPYPIYSKWFDEYAKVKPGIQINYQSIGSGGGIRQVTEHTVDFGASDGPMSDEQLQQQEKKVLHIPTVLGAVVPVFNVKGVQDLNLTEEALSKIYLGQIKKWNDSLIQKENPGVKLPDSAITVVHRADGSGTTYCFVDYLSKVSKEWQEKVGKGTSVNWPVGLGGKGNEGVAGLVKQMPNSIGYVELIYAEHNGLPHAAMRNLRGKFVKASVASVTEAASSSATKMPKDFRVSITNASGEKTYPISTFTWLLVYEKYSGKKGQVIKDFLSWMLNEGQEMAPALGYAPLPSSVITMVKNTLSQIQVTDPKGLASSNNN